MDSTRQLNQGEMKQTTFRFREEKTVLTFYIKSEIRFQIYKQQGEFYYYFLAL